MQAVILAGGFGKRLAPLTSEVPKPLLPVGGRPILVRQIEWLKRFGVRDGRRSSRRLEMGGGWGLGFSTAWRRSLWAQAARLKTPSFSSQTTSS